ncbi:hypothetical protein CBR_g40290 [Chara braunii]|uniref:Uncharacterized protein n=1 Tax=Chara braunii TaxID=69332 RepID=A0A388K263_CHABU|nr:hypothetical protein CBR_g40290 [Chara braunii]|eukprot:GBG64043.1 hypothetical protein CBR_g40290 [Chara braunii]
MSPRQRDRLFEQRLASEEPGLRRQLEDLASTVATMKEFVEIENAKKLEKAKRKQEQAERKLREEEERRAEEQARSAEERRRSKKEDRLRREAEAKERFRKEMLALISLHEERGCRRLTLYTSGGSVWCGGWKSVRNAFGRSIVKVKGTNCKLSECKAVVELGTPVEVSQLRRWRPKAGPDKQFLTSLLRNPRRTDILNSCSLEVLVRLNGVAADFQKQSTTAYLRRLVSRSIKHTYGWNLNARMIVRLKFDDRIHLVEVWKLVNDVIGDLDLPLCMKYVAWNGVRIVWVKNPSVADLIHNQHEFSKADVLTCTCAGFPYPRMGGHVQCRLQELDEVHPLLCNANNAPKQNHPERAKLLMREVSDGVNDWSNFQGVPLVIREDRVAKCLTAAPVLKSKCLEMDTVGDLKQRLPGLVLTPLDRNPGETLVLCPRVYYEAMLELFVRSPGYTVMSESEQVLMTRMKADAKELGLQRFVRWDNKGHFGEAYALPKHKELVRYQPICPMYAESTVRTCKVVAKVLNHLMNTLPIS